MTSQHRERIRTARSVVVKVGTTALTTESGMFDAGRLAELADAIETRMQAGSDVVIVSSGAIAAGLEPLGLARKPKDLATKQAAASVGQVALVNSWSAAFARYGRTVGQVLLTAHDIAMRVQHNNAQRTLDRLRALRAVAIVNENDTVATNEIRFGDNDRLSALVAHLVGADALVLLSDIDGLYDAPPKNNPNAKLIPVVESISSEIEAVAGDAESELSRGGMRTKVEAAKIATTGGTHMLIASGKIEHHLQAIADGGRCTWFLTPANPITSRKRWIAGSLEPKGTLTIDAGAVAALRAGASLLPAGVIKVEGQFARGDAVVVRGPDTSEIGRGLIAYDADDAERIKGRSSPDVMAILGISGRSEMIHRDDLVVGG